MNANRLVVVTGAAAGMGLGISKRFAANGHPVAMLDVQEEALHLEAEALRSTGALISAHKADVSNRDEIDAAYAAVRQELGPISIVIANAGYSRSVDFATMPFETWRHMIDVNLSGAFHTIQAAINDMIAQRWGRIITISSHAAQVGAKGRSHYAAAKGGVIAFTKSLANEYAAVGITVNTIPPSLVETPLAHLGVALGEVPPLEVMAAHMPIPRAGTPGDIADACELLCSDKAGYITGQQINVSGGVYM
jgi:NAD(P)-dependent dehydrogenase (short-subunit alcohol dehydrogenase family)